MARGKSRGSSGSTLERTAESSASVIFSTARGFSLPGPLSCASSLAEWAWGETAQTLWLRRGFVDFVELAGTTQTAFKTAAFNHSAIPPQSLTDLYLNTVCFFVASQLPDRLQLVLPCG